MLKWRDKDRYLLTEEASYKGFQYLVFWGMTTEMYYARIFDGDVKIDEYCNGNPNFGKKSCKAYCERHAKSNSGFMGWINNLWRKS